MTSVPYYEEVQTAPPWMGWTIILSGMGMLTFLLILFVDRFTASAGVWNGDLTGLLGAAAGTAVSVGVAAWLVFSHRLAVWISDEGIRYLFVPTFWKPRKVSVESVVSFEVRKLSFWEYIASGGRRRTFPLAAQKKEICLVRSLTVADLALTDGRRILLGTRNPDGMRWALKKLKGAA